MEKPSNLILVIFGATGDLTSRKLIPALYSLRIQGLMPEKCTLIGVGRTDKTVEEFRKEIETAVKKYSEYQEADFTNVPEFVSCIEYHRMDFLMQEEYEKLRLFIERIIIERGIGGNIIFYMATPPNLYETISTNLSKSGLGIQKDGFRRFIIEKPFGYDFESAQKLNRLLHELVREDQIFRIDHYLGKETVQNLLVTRFANGIFEPLWNRNYVHRIEITSAESIGVENRGSYYDTSGALRDMVQNHLLQMVGLIAMEPPSSLDPDAIRNEVLKVFQSLQPITEEGVEKQVIRGQYTPSKIRGECVTGYRYEKGVDVR